ncbi:carboxypeptidase-like regulatory domain-containing protein, partial [Pedobacter sp.]
MQKLLKSIRLLWPVLVLFSVLPTFAQQNLKSFSGTVTDEEGGVLVGVYVRMKEDTKRSSVSDKDGKFTIKGKDNETVVFTLIGYQKREILAKNLGSSPIKLKEDLTSLQEVVVIGYGQVSKQDLTGSVGQVKIEEMTKAPVTSFEEALAGRIAGVQVSSNSGQPGDD